jgi:hypothetical protein
VLQFDSKGDLEMEMRVQNVLVTAAGLAGLAFLGALMPSPQAEAQNPNPGSAPVNIVSPLPLPVQITGSPSISGTVLVGNPVSNPVRVRDVNDGAQPVHASLSCSIPGGSIIGCTGTLYTVPSGKRLVIEYASLQATCILPGQSASLRIGTSLGGVGVGHVISQAPAATSASGAFGCNNPAGSSRTAGGQHVRIYADPLTSVSGEVLRETNFGTAQFTYAISGYLVDVPLVP